MTATPLHMTETPKERGATPIARFDLIEDVLRHLRLSGSIFLRGEFTAPWCYRSTDAAAIGGALGLRPERLLLFHLVTEGECTIELETGEQAVARAGDALVMPYCDVHLVGSPRGTSPIPIGELLSPPPWREMPVVRIDGGGQSAGILCGYLQCDDQFFSPILGALPRLVHVRATSESAARWRMASFGYLLEQTGAQRDELMDRLPALVLADCLRQFVADMDPGERGWLSAMRDPVLSQALLHLHAHPSRAWTVPTLAREVAVSRTVLADRFRDMLGTTPMRYLAEWRLQLAADLLRSSDRGLAAIAARIGYASEAAFSRAFKRWMKVSPAAWREASRATARRSTDPFEQANAPEDACFASKESIT